MSAMRPRIASVDVVRVLAILAVIAIHTTPFESAAWPIGQRLDLATLINQAARFAVPFFLVVAGYFWGMRVAEAGQVRGPTLGVVRNSLVLWLAWSLVYLLPVNLYDALALGTLGPLKVIYWKVALVLRRPAIALLEGTSPHLWFLVALAFCATATGLFVHRQAWGALAGLAALLYALGLAGQSYPDAPFGFHIDPSFRNGHLYALAFFVTGAWLHHRGAGAARLRWGLGLALLGFAFHLLESWLGHRLWGEPLERDYVAGTYFLGVGTALVALSSPRLLQWPAVAAFGPRVRGVYASHMVFVGLLAPLDRQFTGSPFWEVAYVVAVFALALAFTGLLARFRLTRPLVT